MTSIARLKALGALAVTGALLLWGGPALAAQGNAASLTCTGGDIASGTYSSVTVTGSCTVPADATITITGNLQLTAGAALNADGAPSTITVDHNVVAGPGSWLGLGCTMAHGGCADDPTSLGPYAGQHSTVTVMGNVTLNQVYNAALDGITVKGNVSASGGGAGLAVHGFIPFSVKDDHIGGNLTVSGLTTTWFGVIRTAVAGNVILTDIHVADPDGNEIVHDSIGKNIMCAGMDTPPQPGDAITDMPPGYQYSTVGGRALGQCAFVVAP